MRRQHEGEEGWCNYTYATRDSYFLVLRSCSVSDFKVKYKVRTLKRLPSPTPTPLPSFIYCAPGSCSFSLLPIQFAWNSYDKIHRLAGKAPSSQSHLAIHHSHDWKFDEEGGSAGNLSVARPGCFYRNFLPIFSSSRLTSRLVILGPTPEHYTQPITHQSNKLVKYVSHRVI